MTNTINKLILDIEDKEILTLSESFDYAKICSDLLYEKDTESLWRRLLVNILHKWLDKSEGNINFLPAETQELWSNLMEIAGFYPYIEKEKQFLNLNNLWWEIRKESHLSKNISDKYLHEEQSYLGDIIFSGKNLILSAPTSFWKSLLIEEIIASGKYKNILIIQPTLALLDETRKKLRKYSDKYKLLVRTSQEASTEKGNLFLFTSERVLEYSKFPNIDFLIIDEFYKLSTKRDDERADHLNNAFYFIYKNYKPQFYLLWPNIKEISEGFSEKYNAVYYKTDYSLIDNRIIDLYNPNKEIFDKTRHHSMKGYTDAVIQKEKILFDLLFDLRNEQNIIYCSSPNRARKLAEQFCEYLSEKWISADNELPLIEWIKENIDERWNLIKFIQNKIGINDGWLQKHINSSMIKYFNDWNLNFIFCTSTIIEWVNTSAKNIIIFDSKKGWKEIDYFDYSNIKWRAWRMMIHYIWKIYEFNSPPKEEDILIDIPFFEQNPDPKLFSPEMEITMADEDIKDKTREQYKDIQAMESKERDVIKKNGLLVSWQKNIIRHLEDDITEKHQLICWNGYPTYEQLKYILGLAWDNLIKPGETTSPMTRKRLVKMTFDYWLTKDIKYLIQSTFTYKKTLKQYEWFTDYEIYNESIKELFQILRHWFQYKVPKWLSVLNELQIYVCKKHWKEYWNYTYYWNLIENDFLDNNLAILFEMGIPKSAIDKFSKSVNFSDLSEDLVTRKLKEFIENNGEEFIQYEIDTINFSI